MGKLSKENIERVEKAVSRDALEKIHEVIFPNRFQIGIDSTDFMKGLQVYGNVSVSGSSIFSSNGYLNFGKNVGSAGYGFRDNNGTVQFRNKSTPGQNTSWTSFGGGGGTPAGSNTQIQFNDSGSFGADSTLFFEKATETLTVGSTGLGGDKGVIKVYDTISGSIHHTGDGLSYLIGGANITVASMSNGQVTISGGAGITAVSGSTSVANIDNIDFSKLGFLQNLGNGDIAVSGTIGTAEDGSYSDGLFTDFSPETRIGIAIDRFNEVLKGLAPGAAPSLDNMDSDNYGVASNLSFGTSQSVTGYTNVQPSTLSSPTSTLADVDINGAYNVINPTDSDIRAAAFNGSTTIHLKLEVSSVHSRITLINGNTRNILNIPTRIYY